MGKVVVYEYMQQKEKPNCCKLCGSNDARILFADIVGCERKRYFVMCSDCGYVLCDPKDKKHHYVKDFETAGDAVNAWNADTQ